MLLSGHDTPFITKLFYYLPHINILYKMMYSLVVTDLSCTLASAPPPLLVVFHKMATI